MNRLSRDEILHEALRAADIPQLDELDRPGGVIGEHAMSIQWLQRGLDWFYHQWPFAATIQTHNLSFVAGTEAYNLADDHVMDIKDGLLVTGTNVQHQALRVGIAKLIEWKAQIAGNGDPARGAPRRYVISPPLIRVYPTPDKAYTGTLYYYSLPDVLANGATVPTFPSDEVLVEYVRLKALEFARQVDPGTAMQFAKMAVGDIQKAGQGKESERDHIPMSPLVFHRQGRNEWGDWMGPTTIAP